MGASCTFTPTLARTPWRAQIAAIPFDWTRFRGQDSLYAEFAGAGRAPRGEESAVGARAGGPPCGPGPVPAHTPPVPAPAGAAPGTPSLSSVLGSVLAAVAGVLDGPGVAAGQPLVQAGLDSLSTVELSQRLGAEFGLALPSTLVFDHPTAEAVAQFVHGELRAGREPADEEEVPARGSRMPSPLQAGLDMGTPGVVIERISARLGGEPAVHVLAGVAPDSCRWAGGS